MELLEIIKLIWHDMLTTPWGALLGLFVLCLFLFKEQVRELFSFIIKNKFSYNKTEYSKKDILNHPIFRDLEYWIEKGVDLVKIEKSYAKELIMKDVLKIKFGVIKDILIKVVNNSSMENMNNQELKKFFQEMFREIDSEQLTGFRKCGIPEVFIKKYIMMQQIGLEVVKNTIKVFLSGAVVASNYTKCYLILSVIDSQLTNVYANAVSTALSLNGDLNGIIYKGVVIGSTHSTYVLDNPISKEIIELHLEELISKLHCSRAAVVLFHNYPEYDPFDGKFSIVYEKCAPGVSTDKEDIQHIPAYLLNGVKDLLLNGSVVVGSLMDYDYGINKIMFEHGTEVLVLYPIKDDDSIKGFIKLNWMSKNKFKNDTSSIDLEKELKSSEEDIRKLLAGNNK